MYRRPKFLEVLLEIRQEMAREAGYDLALFTEIVRTGDAAAQKPPRPSSRMMAEPETRDQTLPDLIRSSES